jgi:hypothetical protein
LSLAVLIENESRVDSRAVKPNTDSPSGGEKWFWPTVVVGSLAIWAVEWLLSRSAAAPLIRALIIPFFLGMSALAAWLLMRVGHPPVAAFSVALPIAIALVGAWLVAPTGIAFLVVYLTAIGFFLAFDGSDRLKDWWYRVILFSRWRPPRS